jgi:hypothetical protein
MAATPPVAYDELPEQGARLLQAHRFFAEQARAWLRAGGTGEGLTRATALEKAVRDLLQLVVIDLTAEENAQEIFDAQRARAQLTAADLIKNCVFQRIVEEGGDVQAAYDQYWREFEKKHAHRTATLLQDGQIDVDGQVFGSPSAAGSFIAGRSVDGWHFFVEGGSKRKLADLWRDYVDQLSVDVDDDDTPDDDDDDV